MRRGQTAVLSLGLSRMLERYAEGRTLVIDNSTMTPKESWTPLSRGGQRRGEAGLKG